MPLFHPGCGQLHGRGTSVLILSEGAICSLLSWAHLHQALAMKSSALAKAHLLSMWPHILPDHNQ